MDKKVRNKILYVAVACLWGIAIYRTFKNQQIKEENESFKVVSVPPISPIQFNKDTFELELPSHDPFLSTSWTPSEKFENQNPSDKIQKVEPVEIVKPIEKVWPKIEYFGFVKNRNKNSTLCLLKINGRQIQLSKGQKHEGVFVANTFRDSVLVVYDGANKMIRK